MLVSQEHRNQKFRVTPGDVPKGMQHRLLQRHLHTVFIAVPCTITKLWKQPRCPTIGEWIKKMCYLYTMEFYSAMKKNEILSFADKWMELENIILSEISQPQKTKNCMFSLICRH
jgi:hypothetical protein